MVQRSLQGISGLCLLFACSAVQAQNSSSGVQPGDADLKQQLVELRMLVETLRARVDELEKREPPNSASQGSVATESAPGGKPGATTQASATQPSSVTVANPEDALHGTTFNLLLDTYYAYNFNDPIGRVNLLRAYDVSSNAFSLNQAALILENAADPDAGKRFGLRVDFQYGQATETLQGNPINEPRPDIYRNIFQAYGTYVFPVAKGLTVDFGKFASSLGVEGNYAKDQMNYSRSFWFDFLPYYHMGLRASLKINDRLAVNYWSVNGTDQTEPFNGFKDEFFGLTIQPAKTINWNVNYYLGQEHPDVIYYPNGVAPAGAPTQQGVPFEPIVNPPKGKLDILDSYLIWQATPKLTLTGEGDYVVERLYTSSSPSHTDGGAGYVQYQLTPKFSLGGRAEYLSDRGGLFTGVTQAVKETTVTTKYTVQDGLLIFGEWRRDFSNVPYFYTDTLGILKHEQNTSTVGLVWWLGGKKGTW